MVTAEAVWEALAEIPDPEIPVISLVDLGVVKEVAVEGERVRVEFTPTFMGCPALERMRTLMEESIRELGAEPQVDVLLDDSWSTDRISAEGREKLREAGFAPPAPRGGGRADARPAAVEGLPLPVLRLDGDEARQHLRPDPVPVGPLLRELPPAVRAVQDDLRTLESLAALRRGLSSEYEIEDRAQDGEDDDDQDPRRELPSLKLAAPPDHVDDRDEPGDDRDSAEKPEPCLRRTTFASSVGCRAGA